MEVDLSHCVVDSSSGCRKVDTPTALAESHGCNTSCYDLRGPAAAGSARCGLVCASTSDLKTKIKHQNLFKSSAVSSATHLEFDNSRLLFDRFKA